MAVYRIMIDRENPPNISDARDKLSNTISNFGIPISRSKTLELSAEYKKQLNELYKKIEEMVLARGIDIDITPGNPYIDFTGRKKSKYALGCVIPQMLGMNPDFFENTLDTYSVKLETLKELASDIKKHNNPEFAEYGYNFLNMIIEYKELSSRSSGLHQFYEAMEKYQNNFMKFLKDNGVDTKGKTYNDFQEQLNNPDIYYLVPEINTLETGRLSTAKPNIQGKSADAKSLITAEKGQKLAFMDLKGQEVHILIWMILRNENIKKLYLKYEDPYRAILEAAGLEFSKELRNSTKILILGMMNGMELFTALSRIDEGHKDAAKTIHKLITEDQGYKEIVLSYVNFMKNQPKKYRMGLLGNKKLIEGRFSKKEIENKLKNGFFQFTAGEIVASCIMEFYKRQEEYGFTDKDLRIITPIYDEFIISYREEIEDTALTIFTETFKPIVNSIPRFLGKPATGYHYEPKD